MKKVVPNCPSGSLNIEDKPLCIKSRNDVAFFSQPGQMYMLLLL